MKVFARTAVFVALGACSVALYALGAGIAMAAAPSIDHLKACMSEPEDAKRLSCYDREMGRTAASVSADFGLTPELLRQKQEKSGIAPEPPKKLSAAVTNIVTRNTGRLLVTLDNGQVWEQQEDFNFLVKAGDVITIKPGALGSLWMELPSHRSKTRVKRVR